MLSGVENCSFLGVKRRILNKRNTVSFEFPDFHAARTEMLSMTGQYKLYRFIIDLYGFSFFCFLPFFFLLTGNLRDPRN